MLYSPCEHADLLMSDHAPGCGRFAPRPDPRNGLQQLLSPLLRSFGRCNWDLRPARQLFWIEAECVELPAPFSRRIPEPFDADAAG